MQLDVRIDGYPEPIGHLVSDNRSALAFAYTGAYRAQTGAIALSLSLPLSEDGFEDALTRAYFDNLLQERDTARQDIIARYDLANDDLAGILFHLGKDCPGAISVLPIGAPPVKVPGDLASDYTPYSDERLNAIALALYERRPLPADIQDPSPLAGVQSKIAVARLPDGTLAEPKNGAPTTHILKIPQENHERDAQREHAAMFLSRDMGFETADTEVLEIDGVPALLIKRYDRILEGNIVTRIHQEDFCQALGLPARLKYERRGEGDRRFSVARVRQLLDRSIDPANERLTFARQTIFDILVGNVDGHAKNFSIFHLPGDRIKTTPRYDVMPTMLDRNTTDEFAYNLGKANRLENVDEAALDAFLDDLGFTSAAGRKRILNKRLLAPTIEGLNAAIANIDDKNFRDLIGTNIRALSNSLGREPPEPARSTDLFVR